jgi:hypothetical protein
MLSLSGSVGSGCRCPLDEASCVTKQDRRLVRLEPALTAGATVN